MISVIMQSFLGSYPNAASDREFKFQRAVESVIAQTYKNWELIVIADGCDKTTQLIKEYLSDKITCYRIQKQLIWSGTPRNIGIGLAKGDWIVYLDTDDFFGDEHLEIISKELKDLDWYFFNDLTLQGEEFRERKCTLTHGGCGTSNIVHRKKFQWEKENKYANDDYKFIKKLMKTEYKTITTPQYYVAHIPLKYDV